MIGSNSYSTQSLITPPPLEAGDEIAILSPATEVKEFWVRGAVAELTRQGYRPVVMPHALGPLCGTYAASDAERREDLVAALEDPNVKAILCARGGYGCVHLLSPELQELVTQHPKWIWGFSDVSALHALWQHAGIRSLHCSMAKQLTLFGFEHQMPDIRDSAQPETPSPTEMLRLQFCTRSMLQILSNSPKPLHYEAPSGPGVIEGRAEGIISGGNLAVLNGLAATPWDTLSADFLKGKILFLEDIGEKIYQVERMLKRLQLAGVFNAIAGVIFGQFTSYPGDKNFSKIEDMIIARLREWKVTCPATLGFPIGHTSYNLPIPEGAYCRLEVENAITRLTIYP